MTSHVPRLSVCIPTYNGAAFLNEAIESVLTQEFSDFELLIVDDQSTDATLDIACSFVDPRLQVRQNDQRLGIPGNWNRCLALARGEYLCLFHQDDVMLRSNLEQKIQLMLAHPGVSFVHSAVKLVTEESAPSGVENWIENATENFVVDGLTYFHRLLFPRNLICAPTVILRRALCEVIGGFDAELGFTPDYEMWLKACIEGQVGFISQPLIQYRWHGGNASHTFRSDWGVEETLTARCRAIEYFARRTARQTEAELLRAVVEALAASDRRTVQQYQQNTELRVYVDELETLRDKLWSEVQHIGRSWEEQKTHIENQEAHIKQLEEIRDQFWAEVQRVGKSWEEQQVHIKNQQTCIENQQAHIENQQTYIQQLEQERDWFKTEYERTIGQRLRRLARRISPHGGSAPYSGEQ